MSAPSRRDAERVHQLPHRAGPVVIGERLMPAARIQTLCAVHRAAVHQDALVVGCIGPYAQHPEERSFCEERRLAVPRIQVRGDQHDRDRQAKPDGSSRTRETAQRQQGEHGHELRPRDHLRAQRKREPDGEAAEHERDDDVGADEASERAFRGPRLHQAGGHDRRRVFHDASERQRSHERVEQATERRRRTPATGRTPSGGACRGAAGERRVQVNRAHEEHEQVERDEQHQDPSAGPAGHQQDDNGDE